MKLNILKPTTPTEILERKKTRKSKTKIWRWKVTFVITPYSREIPMCNCKDWEVSPGSNANYWDCYHTKTGIAIRDLPTVDIAKTACMLLNDLVCGKSK